MKDNEKGGTCSTHRQGTCVLSVISGFRSDVDDMCALLGYYVELSGNPVTTFRENLLVPSSRVKKSKKKPFFLDLD